MAVARPDGTVRPAYSTMRDKAATFADRFQSGEYFDFNADESLKPLAEATGSGDFEGKTAEIASFSIQGDKQAIRWLEGQGDYFLPETVGTRAEFDKQYAAVRVAETKDS